MKTKKVAMLGLTIALAMIMSYIEALVPLSFAVPGIKMGLANIVIIFVLYKIGTKEAILVSLIRVILVSLLFSNVMAGSSVSSIYNSGPCNQIIWYKSAASVYLFSISLIFVSLTLIFFLHFSIVAFQAT
mgnify:CR=1 FL=1